MLIIAKVALVAEIALIVGAIVGIASSLGFYEGSRMLGVRDMNGGLAMGVATTILPLASVIGAGIGIWLGILAVRAASPPTIWITSAGLWAVAGAAAVYYLVLPNLNDGNPYDLEGPRPVNPIAMANPGRHGRPVLPQVVRKLFLLARRVG